MTNIKERILQFVEYKQVKKEDFFKELGLSYANFKGIQKNSAISSSAIDKILAKYPEINLGWLFTGEGRMSKDHNYRPPEPVQEVQEPEAPYGKDAMIRALERENELLREMLEMMKKKA
jgi:hypothetical protein